MEEIVTIYTIHQYEAYMAEECGTYFSLVPYGDNTLYYKGETLGSDEYVLPDGFKRVDEDDTEASQLQAEFVDSGGRYWSLGGRKIPCLTLMEYPIDTHITLKKRK